MHHCSWRIMRLSLMLFLACNDLDCAQIDYGELIPLDQVFRVNVTYYKCHIKNLLIPGCVCVEAEGGCIHLYTIHNNYYHYHYDYCCDLAPSQFILKECIMF